jgi:DNA-binding NtrC family response regulator
MKPCVLLMECDLERGQAIVRRLSKRFECRCVATVAEVTRSMGAGPWAAVIARYGLGQETSGVEVLQVVYEALPRAFRLIYADVRSPSFQHDTERLVHAHFVGESCAPDFLDALEEALEDLLEPAPLEFPADLKPIMEDVMTIRAPATRELMRKLRAVAEQDGPVYIYGEPGTGVTRSSVLLRRMRAEWRARGAPGALRGQAPVAILRVPPLRERPQDLPELAMRCLLEQARQSGEHLRHFTPEVVEDLLQRPWYGNVVELSGVIYRAVQRAGARQVIEVEDLPQDSQPPWRASQFAKDEGQRDCVLRQLRGARHVSAAARIEGCTRANYIRIMRRLGIVRADLAGERSESPGTAGKARSR